MTICDSILSNNRMGQRGVTDPFTECRKVTTINKLILERVIDSVGFFL